MAIGDLPTIATSNYATTAYNSLMLMGMGGGTVVAPGQAVLQRDPPKAAQGRMEDKEMSGRRYVRVLVVDPNENIPLDQCVLYAGEEKLTDLNDQELFFELNIKKMLADHNEKRIKVVDKKVKERTEYLELAKIRDLKMVVVTVAQF